MRNITFSEKIFPKKRIFIGEIPLTLDMRWPHERAYYDYFSTECLGWHPAKMDELLVKAFVRDGDVVLDAGANIGITALLFLQSGAACVHAYEPDATLYKRLSRLRSSKIVTHNIALADHQGEADFFVSETHNQGGTICQDWLTRFSQVYGRNIQKQKVELRTIDSYNVDYDIMKIDIEGSEEMVLRGANETLVRKKPRALFIEAYPGLLEGIDSQVNQYFESSWRVGVSNDLKALVLLPINYEPGEGTPQFHVDPPTYLYSNVANECKKHEVVVGFELNNS